MATEEHITVMEIDNWAESDWPEEDVHAIAAEQTADEFGDAVDLDIVHGEEPDGSGDGISEGKFWELPWEGDSFELEQETAVDLSEGSGYDEGLLFAEHQDNNTDHPEAFGGWDDSLEDES